MATSVGRIRLDELKLKPMPNKKQKSGLDVIIGVDTGAVATSDILSETLERKEVSSKKTGYTIEDARKTRPRIDRASVLEKLNSRNIFSIRQEILPSQMPEIEEKEFEKIVQTAEVPVEEVITKPFLR